MSLITVPTESTDKQKVRVKQVALLGLRGDVTAWGVSRPARATGLIQEPGGGGGAMVGEHLLTRIRKDLVGIEGP